MRQILLAALVLLVPLPAFAQEADGTTFVVPYSKRHLAAYINRGNAFKNKGDFDKALANYNKAIRLDPTLAVAYCNRGITWKLIGDYGKAMADYDKAIQLDRTFVGPSLKREPISSV